MAACKERPADVFQVAEVYDVLHEHQARPVGFQLALAQAGVEIMQRPVLLPGEDEALVEMALFQELEAELTSVEILFFRTVRTVPSVAATPSPLSMEARRRTPRSGCSNAAAAIRSRLSGLSLMEDFFGACFADMANYDELVKSLFVVTPAKAGVQNILN